MANLYQNISSRILVIILISSMSGFWLGYFLFEDLDTYVGSLAAQLFHYLIFWLILIAYLISKDFYLGQLLQRPTPSLSIPRLSFFTIMLFAFTTGVFLTCYWPVALVDPTFLEEWILNQSSLIVTDANFSTNPSILIAPTILSILMAAIIAPFTEEVFFRGLLFQRIAVKWNVTAGIIISSALFGLLHGDVIGSFIFAVFMCWLYLNTHTLLAPVFCHILNNTLASGLDFVDLWSNDFQLQKSTTDEYRSWWWFGVILLVITCRWAYNYTRQSIRVANTNKP